MTDFKKKIQVITDSQVSNGVEKSRDRRSKPWLRYYSAPIARRIIGVLEEKMMPQTKLAADLNVTPQQISKIVKGQENLTLETIYKLSIALNFDLISFPEYKYSKEVNSPQSVNSTSYMQDLQVAYKVDNDKDGKLSETKTVKENQNKLATIIIDSHQHKLKIA